MEYDFCDAHFHLIPFLENSGGISLEKFGENSNGTFEENVLEKEFTNLNGNASSSFLEKNLENSSEHFLKGFWENSCGFFPPKKNHFFCTCAHSKKEFFSQEKMLNSDFFCREKIVRAFGIHPQNPVLENADFLEGLLREKKIGAVGEAGFDFFSDEFRENAAAQEEAWNIQLQLAQEYGATLVVHARRAAQKIFEYTPKLKKLRAVVFHSFATSALDARSILRRGVNAYFSFGKPILNGAKKAISCVKFLPEEKLLFETDAPFQTLRGERATPPSDIARVYQCAFELRSLSGRRGAESEKESSFAEFCAEMRKNFLCAFGVL